MELLSTPPNSESPLGQLCLPYYVRFSLFMRRWLTTSAALGLFPFVMPHPAFVLIGCICAWIWDYRYVKKAADYSIRYVDILARFRHEPPEISEDELFYNPPKQLLWKIALKRFAQILGILSLIQLTGLLGIEASWRNSLIAIVSVCAIGWISRCAAGDFILTTLKRFHAKPLSAKFDFPIYPINMDLWTFIGLNLFLWPFSPRLRKIVLHYLLHIVGALSAYGLLVVWFVLFGNGDIQEDAFILVGIVPLACVIFWLFLGACTVIAVSIGLRHSYVAEYLLQESSSS